MNVSDIDKHRLYEAALEASRMAYAPYSHFPVGAAVLVETGEIFAGCNVENASYGLTICAERNAIFQAVAKGNQAIRAVLVYTPTEKPTTPCGACRQVLNEFAAELPVFCVSEAPKWLETTLSELLPRAFGPHNLE